MCIYLLLLRYYKIKTHLAEQGEPSEECYLMRLPVNNILSQYTKNTINDLSKRLSIAKCVV
jgi:hypothetical protein